MSFGTAIPRFESWRPSQLLSQVSQIIQLLAQPSCGVGRLLHFAATQAV